MTHNFTKTDWQQINNAYSIEFQLETSEDKPLIQVYLVDDNGAASPVGVGMVISENILTLLVPQMVFNGYVVIK